MISLYRIRQALVCSAIFAALLAGGCGKDAGENTSSSDDVSYETGISSDEPANDLTAENGSDIPSEDSTTDAAKSSMLFTDVFGNTHNMVIDEDAELNTYDSSLFLYDDQGMTYADSSYSCRLGIDVSYYQGDIDWTKVKGSGYEFVFIRIGYRGYGESGTLNEDENFYENLEGALAAGLDTGVYFFSQALNEEEAAEEADFVLELLSGVSLSLPVVYDPEFILDEEGNKISGARTSGLDGGQITQNTLTFMKKIEQAGYDAAFYSNMLSESEVFDMKALTGYTVWYADYEASPQTPYQFEYWQYSESGSVPGIDGVTDLNIQLIPR